MATFQPPPTYAEVVLYDKDAQDPEQVIRSARFNPIWLKWFVDVAASLGIAGTGSVSSVALSLPSEFSVGGSPITTTGTLAASWVAETHNFVFAGPTPSGSGTPTFRALVPADLGVGWTSWTPTRTNWTDVGSPTVTALYTTDLNKVFFQIKVVPGTSVATVAGTSYVSLPVTAAGISGDASMGDLTTLISVGNCVIDVANSRCYVPAQAATADSLLIAGWYEK